MLSHGAACSPHRETSSRRVRSTVEVDCGFLPKNARILPWHATIYTKSTNRQACGGVLVGPKTVLSAAHCYNTLAGTHKPSSLGVALGTNRRSWDEPGQRGVQTSDVSAISIPATFAGVRAGKLESDLAVLTLASPVVFNEDVLPVCLDFKATEDLGTAVGKIAGYGGVDRPQLKVAEMPYVSLADCLRDAPVNFKPYITADKFCAGHVNDTNLCRGDSGAGLAFPKMDQGFERYYLRGIASTAASTDLGDSSCYALSPPAFTDLAKHSAFLQEFLEKDPIQVIRNRKENFLLNDAL